MLITSKVKEDFKSVSESRDNDGFINLDDVKINFDPRSKEMIGTILEDKNWIEFSDGKKFLMREEKSLDKENASVYSELIVEELASQVGIQNAHYDLYKRNGKIGVLSEYLLKADEEMFTLESLVGKDTEFTNYPDSIDSIRLQENMLEFLKKEGLTETQIRRVLINFQKKMIFDIFCLNVDNHTENVSFITRVKGDETSIDISPSYDNELCLMLDSDIDMLKQMDDDPYLLDVCYSANTPRIIVASDDIEYEESTDIWRDSLDFYCENNEGMKFAKRCIEELDIEKALFNVEQRIGAAIPKHVKSIATKSFNLRKNDILFELDLDMNIDENSVKKLT